MVLLLLMLLSIAVPTTTDGYDVADLVQVSVDRYGRGRRQQADLDATGPARVHAARRIGRRGRQRGLHVVHHVLVMMVFGGLIFVVVVEVVQLMQRMFGHSGRRRVQVQVYLVLVHRRVQVRVQHHRGGRRLGGQHGMVRRRRRRRR